MGNKSCCSSKEPEEEARGDEPLVQVADDTGALQTGAATGASNEEREIYELDPGKNLTVMMFGMTGSGKSALGNLIAGSETFSCGDDTISMTNLDSVMRYEAEDGSLVLLDTIGLGDTEIDQTRVVASIRDVALSAPGGIDVLFFVMRNARITDDAIARLVFATEFLWGSQCLLNLYIVVTYASRYLASKEEAQAWIDRQAEINWRFRHIYKIVGNNPNRFIFIDNPDPSSGEPNVEGRRAASRHAVMRTLCLHPVDAIPPFTFSVMKRAKELTGGGKQPREPGAQDGRPGARRRSSRKSQEAAKGKQRQVLEQARHDQALEREAQHEVAAATLRFRQMWEADMEADAGAGFPRASLSCPDKGTPEQPDGLRQACKRLAGFFFNKGRRSTKSSSAEPAPKPEERLTPAPQEQVAESVLLEILAHVRSVLPSTPEETFFTLDKMGIGAITPMEFTQFLRSSRRDIKHQHVGSLWRRADLNCDGQLDLREFCTLFSSAAPAP